MAAKESPQLANARLGDFHPGTLALLGYFEYAHLPIELQEVSREFHALAHRMALRVENGPELTAGLRKLLEAKDCMVRAALDS